MDDKKYSFNLNNNNNETMCKKIYLDNSATTKPKKEVIDAMLPYLYDKWYNPSSLYTPSKEIKKEIENVKNKIADTIHAKPNEIFFTSGGSESNCMAIQGLSRTFVDVGYGNRFDVITSKIEHNSIIDNLNEDGAIRSHFISNDDKGIVDLNKELFDCIDNLHFFYGNDAPILISIQMANNEIGTIQDIKSLKKYKKNEYIFTHTDAVQAYGHIPIDVKDLGVDMLSVSGHKIGTPKGIGFLYIKQEIQTLIRPLISGSQQLGLRGGTENVPYIMALGKAVDLMSFDNKNLIENRKYFEQELIKIGFRINGSDYKLPNNINATYTPPKNYFTNEALIYMLDMFGIYISSGSACNSSKITSSHVLKSIGLSEEEAMRTIRITLPPDITKEEIDYVIYKIKEQIEVMNLNYLNKIKL